MSTDRTIELGQLLYEIYEEYAGMEGHPSEYTASYLCEVIGTMRRIATKGRNLHPTGQGRALKLGLLLDAIHDVSAGVEACSVAYLYNSIKTIADIAAKGKDIYINRPTPVPENLDTVIDEDYGDGYGMPGESNVESIEDEAAKPTDDDVNHPAHYTKGGIECWDYIQSQKMDYMSGCMVQYATRWPYKGTPKKDLRKIVAYANKLIDGL